MSLLSRRNLFLALGMITAVMLTAAALIASTSTSPTVTQSAGVSGGQN